MRYPVLEVTATVEPFENGRGFTLGCCGPGNLGKFEVSTPNQSRAKPLRGDQLLRLLEMGGSAHSTMAGALVLQLPCGGRAEVAD